VNITYDSPGPQVQQLWPQLDLLDITTGRLIGMDIDKSGIVTALYSGRS
jgi:hypothetical protein